MFSQSLSERPRRHGLRVAAALVAVALSAGAAACGGVFEDGDAAAEWSPAPQLAHRRSYPASTEIDGKIYVAAGMVGETGRPLDFLELWFPPAVRLASLGEDAVPVGALELAIVARASSPCAE